MCGYRVEKSDGCDLIECLCGYRFCYRCGAANRTCSCNPGHGFLNEQLYVTDAPVRDANGRVDLRLCIRRREVREERHNKLEANRSEELAHWQYSSKFHSVCTFNGRWLFSSKINSRCIAMLTQQLEQARVNRERFEERNSERNNMYHYEKHWEICFGFYNRFRATYEREIGRISNQSEKKLNRMSGVLKQMEKVLFRGFGVWCILFEVVNLSQWREDLKRYERYFECCNMNIVRRTSRQRYLKKKERHIRLSKD